MTAPQEPTNPSNLFSPFLPATFNIPEEEDRRKVFLNDKFSAISDVVNDKKIGCYTDYTENFNGEKWVYITPKKVRNGYQAIAYVPSFPTPAVNAGVLVIPNPIPNVTPQLVVTHTWGSATLPCSEDPTIDDGNYFSFPNVGNPLITFIVRRLTITITSTFDFSAYSGFIVIEYLRDGF